MRDERSRTRIVQMGGLVLIGWLSAVSPIYGQAYPVYVVTPSFPLQPTSREACRALQAAWDTVIVHVDSVHQKCLDDHKSEAGTPEAGGKVCSHAACQQLHDLLYGGSGPFASPGYREEQTTAVAQCDSAVSDYEAQQRQAEAEARRRDSIASAQAHARAPTSARRDRATNAGSGGTSDSKCDATCAQLAAKERLREAAQHDFDQHTADRQHLLDQLHDAQDRATEPLDSATSHAQTVITGVAAQVQQAQTAVAAAQAPDAPVVDFDIGSSTEQDGGTGSDPDWSRVKAAVQWARGQLTSATSFTNLLSQSMDQVTEPLDNTPLTQGAHTVVHTVLTALLPSHAAEDVGPDRGELLRTVREYTGDQLVDWLHNQVVALGAQPSSNPAEEAGERTFSAAQLWNLGFGLQRYLNKVQEEGTNAIARSFGMIVDDPDRALGPAVP
ncbi:MAG TPA: hypothetical protein VNU46_04485 [Gemmatimonadaceae bacterium]|jgi:hypothetical protein|nr:hypothetical protein [Gemmatimonadaceae bacterium]